MSSSTCLNFFAPIFVQVPITFRLSAPFLNLHTKSVTSSITRLYASRHNGCHN
jgi:hypothetical protein